MKILIILTLFLLSCSPESREYVKPFIIISKFPNSNFCNDDYCGYTYQDFYGRRYEFCEEKNKYNIGDTIK